MPHIRLFNPRRRRRKTARRGRRNRNKGGTLTYMANPKRKRRRPGKSYSRRRRTRNPVLTKSSNRHYRRRRSGNPLSLGGAQALLKRAALAIGGGIGARSIPEQLLGERNVGIAGYGTNALTAVVLSMIASRVFKSNQARDDVLMGGAVMIAGRVFEEYVGRQLVEFAQVSIPVPGLSSDVLYGPRLSGEYQYRDYPLPTSSHGPASHTAAALPAPANLSAAFPGPWAN